MLIPTPPKDASTVVFSIFALGGVLQSNLEVGWTGPVLGKKYAVKNVRSFTEVKRAPKANSIVVSCELCFGDVDQHVDLNRLEP